jgi:GNAT superfamily N-acetyltransferase
MSAIELRLAATDADIDRCWPVMTQLRPYIGRADFVARVRAQQATGYLLAFAADGAVRAVAGYRYLHNLVSGHHLYVDDLVSDAAVRGGGFGSALFDWLLAQAKATGCTELHLDSGVQRFDAHRFYLGKGMRISCHHFAIELAPPAK